MALGGQFAQRGLHHGANVLVDLGDIGFAPNVAARSMGGSTWVTIWRERKVVRSDAQTERETDRQGDLVGPARAV